MIKHRYVCSSCFKVCDFSEKESDFFCPKCGEKMLYRQTMEMDSVTNEIINCYVEEDRKRKNPAPSFVIVECPYCHSTNTRKISGFAKLGTLSWGATPKEWHCNRCDSDF